MAVDEKLTALKKAYADVLLNTAKEAAGRIMKSERKAQRYQRELQVSKDESLKMLLRMKQMMDSKIAEAEAISLNQQGKIEELEAQLQEAEDIVKDLRDELRVVESELEGARSNKLQLLDDNCSSIPSTSPEGNKVSSESFVVSPTSFQFHYVIPAEHGILNGFEIQNCQNLNTVDPYKADSYNGCPNVPSTLLVRKEPELYRNVCTQRLDASEGDLKLSLDEQMSENEDEKSALGTGLVTTTRCDSEKRKKFKKNEKEIKQCSNWEPIQSFLVKRKRADRYKKTKNNSSRNLPQKSDEASYVSCMEDSLSPVRSDVHIDANTTSQECPQLSTDRAEPISLASCAQVSVNEQLVVVADCGSAQHPVKNIKVTEDLINAGHEMCSEDNSVITVADTGVSDILLPEFNSSKSCADQENLGQPISERVIKITFQRKRKKEPLNGATGSTSTEIGTSKEEKMDHQVGAVEEEKTDLATRSCRDSGRLVQVARQLISLSEKKW